MTPVARLLCASLIAFLSLTGTALAQNRPEVIQQIGGFSRPVAAAFSPDGKSLFVVNHAHGENGTLRQESFLSRLSLDPQGKATEEQMRFVDRLTAPIDLDFSPVQLGSVPAGALFLVVGSPLAQDEAGRAVKDLSRMTVGLLAIDPSSGRILESVDLSPNSEIRLKGETALLAPTSLCFDTRGNLYIGESGIGGHMFANRQTGRPGIWRLDRESVEELLSGKSPSNAELIRTTSMPGDMVYRENEDMLYFITNHTQGAPSGSVFRISSSDYSGIASMQTLVRGIGALSGVEITPNGRVLMVGNNGELMFPKGSKNTRPVRFRPKVDFSTPGKIGLVALEDGGILIAIPEQSSDAGLGKGQRLSLVRLPPEY